MRSHSSASAASSVRRGFTSSSRPAIALPNASPNVRPRASTSPTLFMCVVSSVDAPGTFSNAKRGTFTAT